MSQKECTTHNCYSLISCMHLQFRAKQQKSVGYFKTYGTKVWVCGLCFRNTHFLMNHVNYK